jgi:acetyl-CoA carboxylase biotin carboxyl carrier protein
MRSTRTGFETGFRVKFRFHKELLVAISVQAHITGTIWKVQVKVGDQVTEGQPLVIIESMKMEMPVESPVRGTVQAVTAQEGASVNEGELLVTLEASS